MTRFLKPERRQRIAQFADRMRARFTTLGSGRFSRAGVMARLSQISVPVRIKRIFEKELPPLSITAVQRPALVILMAGTTVRQYEQAGQLGRLAASLERHARYFRTVLLMTTDRSSYTEQFSIEGVLHRRVPVPSPLRGTALLLLSVLVRLRSVRKATAVLIVDEEAAPAGWLASRLSGAAMSMSAGAPWAPPRDTSADGWRRSAVRMALSRVESVIEWPQAPEHLDIPDNGISPATPAAETRSLPVLVDADLYCPLTTTDPARPRTVGVFVGPEHEEGARTIIGVAERLNRRSQTAQFRVFVTCGGGAEARAAALQGEAKERDVEIEFLPLPPPEMLPDAIARLRLCVAFGTGDPVHYLLRAMASGVPGIAIDPEPESSGAVPGGPDWTHFVLSSGATEEQIARTIETLFREPGIRLRLAREGRRFIVARHSLDALSELEDRLLLGPDAHAPQVNAGEPVFDADAEAEKLAMMLEMVGVARIDFNQETEPEERAA